MARSKPLSFSYLAHKIKRDMVEAIQAAGQLLEQRLKALVSIACPNPRDGPHSPVGGPPYMETGTGRDSIAFHRAVDGFRIGTRSTVGKGPGHWHGGGGYDNQLIYWDQHPDNPRPWISNWKETLGDQFRADIHLAMGRHLKFRRTIRRR